MQALQAVSERSFAAKLVLRHIFGIQDVFDQWFELVHDVDVFNDGLACFFDNFLAVFKFLGCFPFEFFEHFVKDLRLLFPFLANL